MEAVFDFCRAALPWILMGLSVAVLLAKNGSEKKKENFGVEGMCLGMCFGVALGGNTGIGMSLGMLIGLTIGSFINKKQGEKNEE